MHRGFTRATIPGNWVRIRTGLDLAWLLPRITIGAGIYVLTFLTRSCTPPANNREKREAHGRRFGASNSRSETDRRFGVTANFSGRGIYGVIRAELKIFRNLFETTLPSPVIRRFPQGNVII